MKVGVSIESCALEVAATLKNGSNRRRKIIVETYVTLL
jgi:hypothetical protein